jgi:hypothetical protein
LTFSGKVLGIGSIKKSRQNFSSNFMFLLK